MDDSDRRDWFRDETTQRVNPRDHFGPDIRGILKTSTRTQVQDSHQSSRHDSSLDREILLQGQSHETRRFSEVRDVWKFSSTENQSSKSSSHQLENFHRQRIDVDHQPDFDDDDDDLQYSRKNSKKVVKPPPPPRISGLKPWEKLSLGETQDKVEPQQQRYPSVERSTGEDWPEIKSRAKLNNFEDLFQEESTSNFQALRKRYQQDETMDNHQVKKSRISPTISQPMQRRSDDDPRHRNLQSSPEPGSNQNFDRGFDFIDMHRRSRHSSDDVRHSRRSSSPPHLGFRSSLYSSDEVMQSQSHQTESRRVVCDSPESIDLEYQSVYYFNQENVDSMSHTHDNFDDRFRSDETIALLNEPLNDTKKVYHSKELKKSGSKIFGGREQTPEVDSKSEKEKFTMFPDDPIGQIFIDPFRSNVASTPLQSFQPQSPLQSFPKNNCEPQTPVASSFQSNICDPSTPITSCQAAQIFESNVYVPHHLVPRFQTNIYTPPPFVPVFEGINFNLPPPPFVQGAPRFQGNIHVPLSTVPFGQLPQRFQHSTNMHRSFKLPKFQRKDNRSVGRNLINKNKVESHKFEDASKPSMTLEKNKEPKDELEIQCLLCKSKGHQLPTCPDFQNLTLSERSDFVMLKGICMRCISSMHRTKKCSEKGKCSDYCDVRSHKLLHTCETYSVICYFCNTKDHRLIRCEHFVHASKSGRLKMATECKVCRICLELRHSEETCSKRVACKTAGCQCVHHTLIHVHTLNIQEAGQQKKPNLELKHSKDAALLCFYCNSDKHQMTDCLVFLNLTVEARMDYVIMKSICMHCLAAFHPSKKCKSKDKCSSHCDIRSHKLLHSCENSLVTCYLCHSKDHRVIRCEKFLHASKSDRLKMATECKVCRICLELRHSEETCSKRVACKTFGCQCIHHTLIHVHTLNIQEAGQQMKPNIDLKQSKDAFSLCFYCNSDKHQMTDCLVFLNLTLEARMDYVITKLICTHCLIALHPTKKCKSKDKCSSHCDIRSHKLLHSCENSLVTCYLCHSKDHRVIRCEQFLHASKSDRLKMATECKVCRICLELRHSEETCSKRVACKTIGCQCVRHTLIHVHSQEIQEAGQQKNPNIELKQSNDASSLCFYCNSDKHQMTDCLVFQNLTLEARIDYVTAKFICMHCLAAFHPSKKCKFRDKCSSHCDIRSHKLLHNCENSIVTCYLCENFEHRFVRCQKFLQEDKLKRLELAKKLKMCLVCLEERHSEESCTKRLECKTPLCQSFDHSLIHFHNLQAEKVCCTKCKSETHKVNKCPLNLYIFGYGQVGSWQRRLELEDQSIDRTTKTDPESQ